MLKIEIGYCKECLNLTLSVSPSSKQIIHPDEGLMLEMSS